MSDLEVQVLQKISETLSEKENMSRLASLILKENGKFVCDYSANNNKNYCLDLMRKGLASSYITVEYANHDTYVPDGCAWRHTDCNLGWYEDLTFPKSFFTHEELVFVKEKWPHFSQDAKQITFPQVELIFLNVNECKKDNPDFPLDGFSDAYLSLDKHFIFKRLYSTEEVTRLGKELGICIACEWDAAEYLSYGIFFGMYTLKGRPKMSIFLDGEFKSSEIKGKANRLPGFIPEEPDASGSYSKFKPSEVENIIDFLAQGGVSASDLDDMVDSVKALSVVGNTATRNIRKNPRVVIVPASAVNWDKNF